MSSRKVWEPRGFKPGYQNDSEIENRSRHSLLRNRLPIFNYKRKILFSVERHGICIIVGETSCGKSTQIPQYLLENGWCKNDFKIVCTQPRRIAAQTLARRVSEEIGSATVGTPVGYCVPYDDKTCSSTKIKFVTDSILLREAALKDPLLSEYSVVIVDDAHECGVNSSTTLGLLKRIRQARPDLRVIICSATIDADEFLNFFVPEPTIMNTAANCLTRTAAPSLQGTIISIDGRQHAVELLYLARPISNYIQFAVETVFRIVRSTQQGGILCFFACAADVDDALRIAEHHRIDLGISVNEILEFLPLHTGLSYKEQAKSFSPVYSTSKKRRIIFATSLAETSVTVPDVTIIIDTGLTKLSFFDPYTGFERLVTVPISRESAQQRAGRSGREGVGQCYRLYTEQYFLTNMQNKVTPEILRTDLSSFILNLKALGVQNIFSFDMMETPGVPSLAHGLESLYALNAIDMRTNLTNLGMTISTFHTEPRLSRMLLESLKEACVYDVAGIVSVLEARSPFRSSEFFSNLDQVRTLGIADKSGDHVSFAKLLAAIDDGRVDKQDCEGLLLDYNIIRRVLSIRSYLLKFLERFGGTQMISRAEEKSAAIRRCVTAGFFFNVARLQSDGSYHTVRTTKGYSVTLSRSSFFSLFGTSSEYIVFCETSDGWSGGIELRSISSIDPRWLRSVASHYWI